MLFQDVEELDKYFAEIARVKMKETYISTVYLTGPGFNDKWIEESTRVLCDGRRVFMGQNIYTKQKEALMRPGEIVFSVQRAVSPLILVSASAIRRAGASFIQLPLAAGNGIT